MSLTFIVFLYSLKVILEKFGVKEYLPSDYERWRVADIGGGDGTFSSILGSALGLKRSIECVEPVQEMTLQASKNENVIVLTKTGIAFVGEQNPNSIDRILLKECIHHFPSEEVPVFWRGVYECLRPNGVCVVMTRPNDVRGEIPLFEAAFKVWSRNQPPTPKLIAPMTDAGLSVEIDRRHVKLKIPIDTWCSMIRSRFWSTFSSFTDAELEDGIKEIREKHPVDADGKIEYCDTNIYITTTKK